MPKLTPWFPGDVKPVRPGVYERKVVVLRRYYSRWTGSRWLTIEDSAQRAAQSNYQSMYQDLPWRGLAEPPKESSNA